MTTEASVRVVPADVLTPIAAYAALAQPQASCLLESVESVESKLPLAFERARLLRDHAVWPVFECAREFARGG